MSVIVIKSLFLNVLIFSCEHLVPQIKVFGCLLKSHWFHISTDLEIKVTHTNCALSQNHVDGLSYSSVALIFELRINWEGNLSLCEFNRIDNRLFIVEFDYISSTILEPEEQAWSTFTIDAKVLFSNQMLQGRHVACFADSALSVHEKIIAD